jgi:protein-L-isoaspartate O-methyltransferase
MIRFFSTIALSFFLCFGLLPIATPAIPVDGEYKPCAKTSFDGTGKCYFGREIAQVLGHEGYTWLERPGRAAEEKPERAIEALQFSPTDTVADIGAGVGYMSFLIAPQVAKVYAVDVQSEMLDMLRLRQSVNGLTNVETVQGEETTTNLAASSVDWAIMVDAYHEFAYPKEMMASIFAALKPGGKVVLFEYKGENPLVAIKPHHKMTQTQARAEVMSIGFEFVENKRVLPQQHVLVFRKPIA